MLMNVKTAVMKMTAKEIRRRIEKTIDDFKDNIIEIGETVRKNPELGYSEEKTSGMVRSLFDEWGIEYRYPVAYTGVKAKLYGGRHKYNVCIIGEMDALKCDGKNAHACGHNAQLAAMLGAAYALGHSGVMSELDGDITFIAAPAEEFIDIGFRRGLKEEGKIKYFGGKQQMLADGVFDDIDMAMMIHAQGNEPCGRLYVRGHNLGFLAKSITIHGKAVHGSTPFDGVNALNAAALGILGVHANRETFRDEESIRIHPIITKGGDVVNSVPDEVCIDTYVRGASLDAIKKGNRAVNRAFAGACEMIGATYEYTDLPGYLPISESRELSETMEGVAKDILGEDGLVFGREITGSSDIGDVSLLLPTIQPSIGGFEGTLHSSDFKISDPYTAYISAAKILSGTAAELLAEDAAKAKMVKNGFKPKLTKEEYINYLCNREDE